MDWDCLCLSLTHISLVPQPWIRRVLKGTFFLVSRVEFSTQETENSPGKPHELAIPAVAASYSLFIPPSILSLILTTVTTVLTSTWGLPQPVASPSISFLFSLLPSFSPPPFPNPVPIWSATLRRCMSLYALTFEMPLGRGQATWHLEKVWAEIMSRWLQTSHES